MQEPGALLDCELSRRALLKSGALLGGSALLMSQLDAVFGLVRAAQAAPSAYPLALPENVIYSVCLQCHTACPIKVKILEGVAVKIDGNPYSAQNMIPHFEPSVPLARAARIDAKLCPKGQAGIQTLYDPYRIVKVLKRNGPRGSNQWKVIPFSQAVDEIVQGGTLFSALGEMHQVPGLKELYKLTDPALGKAMKTDAAATAKGKLSVADFKAKYPQHLGVLIDPDHPDLGPVNNQLVLQFGRIEHGRVELAKRWLAGSFGSVNFIEHTTICEQSHHIAYQQMTHQYKDGKWADGKTHMKPDAMNAEFILYFGTGFVEANFGPTPMIEKVTDGLASGRLKVAVVDPRLSKSAAKAWKWLPIQPGTDAALALAMTRWIIENGRYDAAYLKLANQAAAKAAGEPTWSNATHLVRMESDGPGKLLRATDLGIGGDEFVIIKDGKPVAVGKAPITGELEFSGELGGVRVKTAFTLLKEEARSRSLAEWSAICGIPAADIEAVARELTAHGKKAAVEFYRGPVQHTNGYYNAQAIITLNVLIGNADHKGGITTGGGHWHEVGDKLHGPFEMGKLHPGALTAFGHNITREKSRYEESTLFAGYPARRPWYPFSSNVYQEVIPSAEDSYPYGIKALWIHMGTPALATPSGDTALKVLADPSKIPLVFATDIVLGDTTMYADYVFPDTAIWERWGTPHAPPDVPAKASQFRQPTVTPLTEVVEVYGERQHCSMEAVMLAIGERLGLSGCGRSAFGPAGDFKRPEDFFLKFAANLAWGDKPGDAVPDASDAELKLFLQARRHLRPSVFDPSRWEAAAGKANWRKVVYLLNRGGRWEPWTDQFVTPQGQVVHKYGGVFNLYVENVARQKHSLSGRRFSGQGIYEPVRDAAGRAVEDAGFPLTLITYKEILGGQSRTLPNNYWLSSILPENYLLLNSRTAKEFGIRDEERVRLVSATNPAGEWKLPNRQNLAMVGKVKTVEGMRPGVVAVSWHFGHWGYGASDARIDGDTIPGERRRGTGLCPNAAMRVDPVLKNVCLTDPIGASSSFFDTRVRLEKV
ncbi:MAG: molybdopterin-dependent oxidoreductase [Candidatus Lambdaproteobacteria bacterium]|nr:molybdopterin-dependent oxidoreductase [Candidatus Lambdaproteobacteria bacterium]